MGDENMSIVDDAKTLIASGKIQDVDPDLLLDAVGAIRGNPLAVAKIIVTLAKTPFFLRDKILWSKLELYLNGVFITDDDRSKLRAKLTENDASNENSKRLLECIDRAETNQKIQYLINATRCFLTDFIDRTTFFRICRTIAGTIDEDLLFVRDNITKKQNFEYSSTIQGLFVSGLVTFSSIGGEATQYAFTPLAEDVDRFAISYDNVARYPNPVGHRMISSPNAEIPTITDNEIQEMFDDVFGEKQAPVISVEMPMGEF